MNKKHTNLFLAFLLVFLALAVSLPQLVQAAPSAFDKTAPADGSTNLTTSGLTLSWNASDPGVTYQYCLRPNRNCPGPHWINVGTNTSRTFYGLTPDKNYYWQVRAIDAAGQITYANGGTWWRFRTRSDAMLPQGFGKTAPADLATNQPVDGLVLTWGTSTNATSYTYCYDTENDNQCTHPSGWLTAASTTATLNGLDYDQTYYWQVRAVNIYGIVEADDLTWFMFTTTTAPPAAFSKTSPANLADNQLLDVTLAWNASAGSGVTYAYCAALAPCDPVTGAWTSTGTALTAELSGLLSDTTYYWQVRATDTYGKTTYANDGSAWSFHTRPDSMLPQGFGKTAPSDGSTGQPVNGLGLAWETSANATGYAYCVDTQDNDTCDDPSGWTTTSETSAILNGLDYSQEYFWQVRATNLYGTLEADNLAWFSFTTTFAPPAGFGKTSPANTAADQPLSVTLTWEDSTGSGVTYAYCLAAAAPCDPVTGTWTENGAVLTANASGLLNDTLYYWQVRATNATGTTYADGAAWSFTTRKAPPTVSQDPQTFNTDEDTLLSDALAASSNYAAKGFALFGAAPAGTLDLSADGSFTYMPVADFNGEISFQFTVDDGVNPPAGPFTAEITVDPVNDEPVLELIPGQNGINGETVTFTASASDVDLPADTLTFSLEGAPAGAAIDPTTGAFSWDVPGSQPEGDVTFTVRVSDGELSDSQLVTVSIEDFFKVFIPLVMFPSVP